MKKILAIVSIIIAIVATIGTVIAYRNGTNLRYVDSAYSAQFDKKNDGAAATVHIKTAVSSNASISIETDDGFYYFYPVYHFGDDLLDRGFLILAVKESDIFFNAWDELYLNQKNALMSSEDKYDLPTTEISGAFVKASEFFDNELIELANSSYSDSISNELYSFGSYDLISFDEYRSYTPGELYLLVDTDGLLGKNNSHRTLVFVLIGIAIASSIIFVIDFILLILEDRRYHR